MQFSSLTFYDNVRISNAEFYNYENSILSYILLYRRMGYTYLTPYYVALNKFWWKDLNSFFNKRKITQVNNYSL